MKAAVLHGYGQRPVYEEIPTPIAGNDQEVLVNVRASSIKQIDLSKAKGEHYTKFTTFPTTIGMDGIAQLEDGTCVYATGITGMMAEKALIAKDLWVPLPPAIDLALAAALPNALMGADMALTYRARIKTGDVVLINGATGATGTMAVQAAKYRGASKVIATGRNEAALETLRALGADETIPLRAGDGEIVSRIQALHREQPIDIVLDYLWGHPMELILQAFESLPPRRLLIVTAGQMAGASISLASALLRSTQLELLGSGLGSVTKEEAIAYFLKELPPLFELAAKGGLTLPIEKADLQDVAEVWESSSQGGKRLVLLM